MAAWKRRGSLEQYEKKLIAGMQRNGYDPVFAEQIFNQIKGFADYGFPESHAASFALLAYASSWLKCYQPAAFTCALLNSQPMGFYQPAQLVQDAQRHGVEVRPVDVQVSTWDCALEPSRGKQPALRLGLRMIKGLSEATAERIVQQRAYGRYATVQDLAQRTQINRKEMSALAAANALVTLTGHRHKAYWEVAGIEPPTALMKNVTFNEADPLLTRPNEYDNIVADYQSMGLSLERHPVSLIRSRLTEKGIVTAKALETMINDSLARVAGIVVNRQRPQTASGVIFATIEDESGFTNLIVWPSVVEKQRKALLTSQFLLVKGTLQKEDGVIHLIVQQLTDLTHWLSDLATRSRNFH
jgi:error-prone DNA polymerase